MSKLTPDEVGARIGAGLLTFPVTPFHENGSFDEPTYREHLEWLLQHDVAGLFAPGGTGEMFSLTPEEIVRVVRVAVEVTNGRVPVLAGVGFGTTEAVALAKAAEDAGADGLLLLPPYLMEGGQKGLAGRIVAVCDAVKIGVVQYNRAKGVIHEDTLAGLAERHANLVGFKDGLGNVELMMRVYATLGDRLTYIGGLPTAETFALPYLEMGVTTYSSAIFNFLPEWALAFYKSVRAHDRAAVIQGLRDFVLPYIALRDRGEGYAVSIVKAGMRAIGRSTGPVRSPLTDLTDAEQAELKTLIDRVGAS